MQTLLDLDLPARPESAPQARRAVADALREVPVDRDAVMVMVSEAVANCAVHAYPDAAEDGRVRVRAELDEAALNVVVSDEGVGMPAAGESSGLGLGVPLMGDLADDVVGLAAEGELVTARSELYGPAGPQARQLPRGRARAGLRRLLGLNR